MHLLQVTIASTNKPQPIIPAAVVPGRVMPFQQLITQNNGSNEMRIGDSSVSSTRGIVLWPSGSNTVSLALQYSGDLTEFYVNGTAGDILDIMVLD